MNAKYSRLPSSDPMEEVKLDFGSAFSYSGENSYERSASGLYKSAFTYKDWNPHAGRTDVRLIQGI